MCARCGLTQLNPRRDEDEEAMFYSQEYYERYGFHAKRKSERWIARRTTIVKDLLDAVERLAPLGGARLLDVGCGYGFLLREARARGAAVAGVEPDPAAAAAVRAEGFDVFAGTLEDFARRSADRFDAVSMSHVVEHVSRPVPFLEVGSSLLQTDGLLAVDVPNLRWHLTEGKHPRSAISAHIYFHSEASLRALFSISGLSVQSVTFGMGGRNVCVVGRPTHAPRLPDLPVEDLDWVRTSHARAARRLVRHRRRRRWAKRLRDLLRWRL